MQRLSVVGGMLAGSAGEGGKGNVVAKGVDERWVA